MDQYLHERGSKILKMLLEHKEPVTINDISRELKVSSRTVRYDIEVLNDFLSQYKNVKIEKKTRVGIWLECSDNMLETIKKFSHVNKDYLMPLSAAERKYHIIKELIQAQDTIKMQNLAKDLYVSRITVHNDLKEVEKWLSRFGLKLIRKQNYGLEISGEEKNWRKAESALLTIFRENKELKSIPNKRDAIRYENRLSYQSFLQIHDFIQEIDVRKIEVILNEAEKLFNLSFTDEAFDGLVIHIAISIRRLHSNKAVTLTSEQLAVIKEVKEFEIGQWIACQFANEIDIDFSESEIAYLTLHIIGSKIHENIQSGFDNKIIDNIDEQLKIFTKELISQISSILGHNLCHDERLYNGLILHLRPAINRMMHGLNLRNLMIYEIKNKLPAILGATWATDVLFEKYYNIKVPEEEIGYIALHISAALERLETYIRVVIVCSSGIGTCELVAARLLRQISNITVVGTFSSYDLKQLDKNDFDLIIATIPVDHPENYGRPLINISALTTDEDINKIKRTIKNIDLASRYSSMRTECVKSAAPQLFYEELTFVKVKAVGKEEILEYLSQTLVNKGFVSQGFFTSVMEREKLTSTAINNGLALPHGGEGFVNRSCIAIASLEKPIDWGEEKVDIIFLMALRLQDKQGIKRFFSYFYSILDDDELIEQIRESHSNVQILELIIDGPK